MMIQTLTLTIPKQVTLNILLCLLIRAFPSVFYKQLKSTARLAALFFIFRITIQIKERLWDAVVNHQSGPMIHLNLHAITSSKNYFLGPRATFFSRHKILRQINDLGELQDELFVSLNTLISQNPDEDGIEDILWSIDKQKSFDLFSE
ncbi:hypothetical protein K7432_000845 [Basidiobolus ranarum]|uniref:Uncharacterized protein n=1 Tax=Basidiobolus ranarum TaxID=34480 RepID=A0ABR2WAI2_9FUNG